MALICTGYNCPKSKECGRCINNLNLRYRTEVNNVQNLAGFGSFTLDSTGVHHHNNVLCGTNGNYAMFELARDLSDIILRKALELAVSDRNYLAEQIYLGAVDGGKLSVDYYIKQAERRLNDEETM